MRLPIFLALLAPSLATAQSTEPLEVRNLKSLSLPYLRIDPRPAVLSRGERTLAFGFTAANELSYYPGGAIKEDYELDRFLIRGRQGIGNGIDVTVDLPLLSRGDGFLDPIVKAWHDTVLAGLNPYRTDAPFGRCYIDLPGQHFGSATGIGDVTIALTKSVSDRSMATVAVKVPTGNAAQLLGSGGIDAALALQTRIPVVRRLDLHLQAGLVAQSPGSALDHTRGLVHQAAFALAYAPNSRDRWVMQLQSEDSATVTGVQRSDTGHRIFSLGYQRKLNARSTFEFFITENQDWPNWPIPHLANEGPDFTAGLKLTRRL